MVPAVRLNVAATLELGETLLNLFEGAVTHIELVAAGLFPEDHLTNPSGGVEIFGELRCSAELLVVLGEAGEQAVYFTTLVAGFGFSGTGKSASAGGAGQGDSSQRLNFKNTNVEAASYKNLRTMSQMRATSPTTILMHGTRYTDPSTHKRGASPPLWERNTPLSVMPLEGHHENKDEATDRGRKQN